MSSSTLRYGAKPGNPKRKNDTGDGEVKRGPSLKTFKPTQSGVRRTSLPKGGRIARS